MTLKEDLISQLLTANHHYSKGFPTITDLEYDSLWQQLFKIDPENSVLYHTTDQSIPFGRKAHKHQIFGTQKAFEFTDLKPFLSRFGSDELIIEPKYDGCAAVFYSGINEAHDILLLEGDGISGSDISHHLDKIHFSFDPKNMESIELVIPNSNWSSEFGSNPRNTVAGWIARPILPYDRIIEAVSHNYGSLNQSYIYNGDLDSLYDLLLSLYFKWSETYPLDGLMIKVASERKRIIVHTNGTFYNWSIAWKPPIETAKTICTSIEWNVSRQGRIIPTVIYDPITLCGSINQRVTGNNAQWIIDHKIQPGVRLTIGKAGSIIPKIISVEQMNEYMV